MARFKFDDERSFSLDRLEDLAHDILDVTRELRMAREQILELEKYKRDYMELLNSATEHNKAMMGNLLQLVMVPGVVEACAENAKVTNRA